MDAPPIGAYGLQVTGIGDASRWLAPVPERFPRISMVFETGPRPDRWPDRQATDDRVVFELGPDRSLVVDGRHEPVASATCWDARPPTVVEAVHPLLTAAAAVVGSWRGYESFHAAGVVGADRVWGILGDKESGKSTLAAAMAANGHPVVCDDMLAVKGKTAFAGPRCVDLRTDAANRLKVGDGPGTGGTRPRWRVALPPLAAELPLAGWVMLAWGDEVALARIPPRDVLVRLGSHRTWPRTPIDPHLLLDLATLPAWELRRPRAWSAFRAVMSTLESAWSRPT